MSCKEHMMKIAYSMIAAATLGVFALTSMPAVGQETATRPGGTANRTTTDSDDDGFDLGWLGLLGLAGLIGLAGKNRNHRNVTTSAHH